MTAKNLLAVRPDLLTEAELSGLVAEVARIGGWTLRYHTLRPKGSGHGFPDWVFVHPGKGRILFVELKSEKGRLTDTQKTWQAGLIQATELIHDVVDVVVWRPSDWDEIVWTLTGRKPINKAA